MISRPVRIALLLGPILALIAMIVFLAGGYSWSIPWEVTTYADIEEFGFRSFQKGPFQFGITGEFFTLAEAFRADGIARHVTLDTILVGVIWLGICVLLTVFSYLPRIWFLVSQGLVIFFLISLHLEEVGLLLNGSKWVVSGVLITVFVLPGYLFHSFGWVDRFELRLLIFSITAILLVLIGGPTALQITDQVITGGYFGFVALILLLLVFISEEIVFGILYLVTKAKGGRNNHIHFISFSLIYLVFIGLYYARRAGLIDWEFSFFNPITLLVVSVPLALWSIDWKKETYQTYLEPRHYLALLSGLSLVTAGFISLALLRGNDPILDATGKFIIYAHLGFGAFFFFYVIVNFIDPLMQGLQVHRVAYKDHTFPYATARIGGFVAIAAFFFYANKQPYLVYRAGQYNYTGQQSEGQGETGLALRFYQEGDVFGHDNHFSNYQLGINDLAKGRIKESNYRFGRAILREPSPQAYVNLAGTYAVMGEAPASQAVLEAGVELFPGNTQLINNLGLTYYDLGQRERAEALLSQDQKGVEWTDASLVNKWKVTGNNSDLGSIKRDYQKGNFAVKANIIAAAMRFGTDAELPFDSVFESSYPLHRQAYLVNQAWFRPSEAVLNKLKAELERPMDYATRKTASKTYIEASVHGGFINRAIYELRQEEFNANPTDRGRIHNQLGLIALEQQALAMAENYFRQAIEDGEASAKMNLVATLLESGRFDEALSKMSEFGAEDSSFFEMKLDFEQMISGENLTETQQGLHQYYFYSGYDLEEMEDLLVKQSPELIRSLWKKISTELLGKGSFELLKKFRTIFLKHLPDTDFKDMDMILAMLETGGFPKGDQYSEINNLPDSLRALQLFELGSMNAFNESRVLAFAKVLAPLSPQQHYDLLVQAIDINQTSVALHKAYCLQAASLGFSDYGRSALARLKELTTPSDFLEFEKEFDRLVKEQDNFSEPW